MCQSENNTNDNSTAVKGLLSDDKFEQEYISQIIPFIGPLKNDLPLTTEDGRHLNAAYFLCETPSDKTVFISHGFTDNMARYLEIVYMFLQNGFNVAIMEHMGHGYSDRMIEGFSKVHIDSFDTYVKDFHLFYESIRSILGTDMNYYLFGHSMGGCIASLYIEQYPQDFSSCVLSSPMHEVQSGGVPKCLCSLLASVLELLGNGKKYLGSQNQDYKPNETFEDAAGTSYSRWHTYNEIRIDDEHYHTCAGTIHWMKEAIKASGKSVKDADRITIPVLITQSGRDNFVMPRGQNRFDKKCSTSSIVHFCEAKHEAFNSDFETRKKFWTCVLDFYH